MEVGDEELREAPRSLAAIGTVEVSKIGVELKDTFSPGLNLLSN